jgi:ribosomal protein S18 acetylase RimI-like enzyme
MHVRKATGADAEAIGRVQERSWQSAYRHVFPTEQLDRGGFIEVERWRERLDRPPSKWTTLVVERDGVVIGFASVGPSRDEHGLGELYAIYVEPESWSSGAGRALLEHAEALLSCEYGEATLWVLDDNPRARSFYELRGWAADGARKAEERWCVRAPEVRYRKRFA